MRTPDPWRVLARYGPRLHLVRWDIPELGRFYPDSRCIVVRAGLTLVEERSVLWHELVHVETGDLTCDDPWLSGKQEAGCVREAARRAIPIESLALAKCWSDDVHELADELKVIPSMVTTRLSYLHPSERGVLSRRLAMKEHTA